MLKKDDKPKSSDGIIERLWAAIESSKVGLDETSQVYDECVDIDAPYPGKLPAEDEIADDTTEAGKAS